MWTDGQRQRYHTLCEREQGNLLTAEEAAELATLVQQFCDAEAAYLAPANERKAQEIAEVTEAVERLENENRQLRDYLNERLARIEEENAALRRHIQAVEEQIDLLLAQIRRRS